MEIEIFSIDDDQVIRSKFINARSNYYSAIKELYPLIDKLDIQRKIQDAKFYRRLERDIIKGCVLPPLTLAFIKKIANKGNEASFYEDYIKKNISSAFVLDGIQRINTLHRAYKNFPELDLRKPIFLNILFCESMDNLLYRMITLNNGQKPMTARHQIEILANNIYNFEDSPVLIQSEKDRGKKTIRGSFNKSDVIKSYIAFLSNSTNIDNQRIIEQKMDELIAEKILDSNITEDNLEFSEVLSLIDKFTENAMLLKWFKNNENNLIGFSVGIRDSFEFISKLDLDDFSNSIDLFEKVFKFLDPSKIRVGEERRKLLAYYISNIKELHLKEENELLDILSSQ